MTAPPYELGAIAACVSERTGKTVTNPYPEGSIPAREWDRGYDNEIAKLMAEQ